MKTCHPRQPACPSGCRRVFAFAALAVTTARFLNAPAYAYDLPGLLLAAARLIPANEGGRTRCSVMMPTPYSGAPEMFDPPASSLKDAEEYGISTRGAYLGAAGLGKAPFPLPEALLEAGAAKRYRLSVPVRIQVPNPVHGNGLPLWATQIELRATDVVVVDGPDAALFPAAPNSLLLGRPPEVNGGLDGQGEPLGTAAVTPPGVWASDRLCLTAAPVRVLEYGDVETRQNGSRVVTAAILFRAERVPDWLADPRVMRSLYHPLLVQEVRFVGFRNDGDGWRPTPVPDLFFIEKKTHLVEGE